MLLLFHFHLILLRFLYLYLCFRLLLFILSLIPGLLSLFQSTAIVEPKKEDKEQLPPPAPAPAPAPAAELAPPAAASTPTADHNNKTIKPMSSSNSFDSTTNVNQSFRFKMSAEANRLFQTLQESPLPVEVGSPEEEPATVLLSYSLSTHLPHPPCSLFVETQAKERHHERHE